MVREPTTSRGTQRIPEVRTSRVSNAGNALYGSFRIPPLECHDPCLFAHKGAWHDAKSSSSGKEESDPAIRKLIETTTFLGALRRASE